MKRILLTALFLMLFCGVNAQNKVYCEIVEPVQIGKKVKIIIDFGQEREKSRGQQVLVNEGGEVIQFNSKIDALNYMSTLGWEFVQAYTVASGSNGSVSSAIHWVLCKIVEKNDDIYKGLMTKEEYNRLHNK